jgi:predicted O-methyltransferase YrrM
MALNNYLQKHNSNCVEGHSRTCSRQTILLQILCINSNIKNILEIGFNAGHSADLFLSNNSLCHVTSFDINQYLYVKIGKEFIDTTYPNRHTLIIGDSTKTIPIYQTNVQYDLIFIDGGHSYEVAKEDLLNCKRFAHKDTIVIMDDTIYKKEWEMDWTVGPTKAWQEGLRDNIITQLNTVDFELGKGMSWGKYNI